MVVQEVRSSDLQGRTEFTPKDFHALSDHLTDYYFRTLSTNFKIGASNFSPTLGQLSVLSPKILGISIQNARDGQK